MHFSRFGVATSIAALVVCSTSAIAGETVRYEATPSWVTLAELDLDAALEGPSEVRLDWQHRIEDGKAHEYRDRIVRVDNLQALTSEGTLQLTWSPDKGDLFIHALEIIRGDEVIDLVADGVEFEVIRRERGLERRLLDGRLTATVAVPGLEEGDMLRLAHSVIVDDQALGDEVQAYQFLPQEPARIGFSRVIMSWPENDKVFYAANRLEELPELETRDGYNFLTLELPIEELEDMPRDAPIRYRQGAVLRAGTFESWTHMSRVMEPHFTTAARIAPDSDLVAEVARIKAATDDPLKRAELATRLVQDQVSYLLNGLDGGNYLPQDADETWKLRYGDCKAKSVLLHALLLELGIESEVVLVKSRGGDAVSSHLPLPASFDHMIVRAVVDGTEYWLDGTTTAARVGNMDAVPPFFYALPLRAAGSELLPMPDRLTKNPLASFSVEIDHTAGTDLPGLFTQTLSMTGPAAAHIQAAIDEDDPETLKSFKRSVFAGQQAQVTSVDLDYDKETAVGTVTLKGAIAPIFDEENGRMVIDFPTDNDAQRFRPNRLKPQWREIPVAVNSMPLTQLSFAIKLPGDEADYTFEGERDFEGRYANNILNRTFVLDEGWARYRMNRYRLAGEIAPEDVSRERRAALQVAKDELVMRAPENAPRRWEFDSETLAKSTAEVLAAYNIAVADADDDEFGPLEARARYFRGIFDYDTALMDYDTLIAEEPTAQRLMSRAAIYEALGQFDEAASDAEAAFGLSSDVEHAFYQAYLLAYGGKPAEALDLLDLIPVSDDDMSSWAMSRAIVNGLAGQPEEGLLLLEERLLEKPDEADILNSKCWFSGLNNIDLDAAMGSCTRAIERSGTPAQALDSRALVHYRLGDLEAAMTDLDAALKLNPSQAGSLFLRGIVMQAQGDKSGREYIEQGLRLQPRIANRFKAHGIEPAK